MDWETILAFALLFFTLISFVLEKVSVDVTALTFLGTILVLAGFNISSNWSSVQQLLWGLHLKKHPEQPEHSANLN